MIAGKDDLKLEGIIPIVSGQRALCGAPLFPPRNETLDPPLEGASIQQYAAPALEAADADIGAESNYLPFVAAAGVFLFQADDIAQPYFHHHI